MHIAFKKTKFKNGGLKLQKCKNFSILIKLYQIYYILISENPGLLNKKKFYVLSNLLVFRAEPQVSSLYEPSLNI